MCICLFPGHQEYHVTFSEDWTCGHGGTQIIHVTAKNHTAKKEKLVKDVKKYEENKESLSVDIFIRFLS